MRYMKYLQNESQQNCYGHIRVQHTKILQIRSFLSQRWFHCWPVLHVVPCSSATLLVYHQHFVTLPSSKLFFCLQVPISVTKHYTWYQRDLESDRPVRCLRTFRLRHFVYRHFVYRYFVYYEFPCWNRSWSDETNTISIEPGLMQGILPN